MNEEGSVQGTDGEGSNVESWTAATAAAAVTANLTASGHEQQTE